MSDLKTLKGRINSIKKTQKITKAMKMVAASKLRKAREAAESARAYSEGYSEIVASQVTQQDVTINERNIVYGVNNPKNVLLILITTDRGLCGGLNSNLVRTTIGKIESLKSQGFNVKIFCIGKKGYEQLKNQYAESIIAHDLGFSSRKITYDAADEIATKLIDLFLNSEFDICNFIYPKFRSAISQEATIDRLFPCEVSGDNQSNNQKIDFEYEPQKDILLNQVISKNIVIQLFQAFLETYASEQGSRMSAMDNAVNNCGELVQKLNLFYNRTRQAKITTELIEIISAVESL